jgi:phospholipase/lecithinase/hemolysin
MVFTATPVFATPLSQPTHLYTFGDSSIDKGRAFELTKAMLEGSSAPEGAYIRAESGYYWQGRYSNGPVYTELLAEHLGVDITSYAVGGAKSGPDHEGNSNWSGWFKGTGGLEQTEEFISDMDGELDPDALYLISIGGNDGYNLAFDTLENVAAASAANIKTMVANLADAGAKNFVVALQTQRPGRGASEFTQAHAAATTVALRQARQELGVNILTVDFSPLNRDIERNPEDYGFATFHHFAISNFIPHGMGFSWIDNTALFADMPEDYGVYEFDGFLGYDENSRGFWTVDEYYFFDEWHVTRKAHYHHYAYLLPLVSNFLANVN